MHLRSMFKASAALLLAGLAAPADAVVVQGMVRQLDGTTPIAGATVAIAVESCFFGCVWGEIATATTDGTGHYSVDVTNPFQPQFRAVARATGFAARAHDGHTCYVPLQCAGEPSTSIAFGSGATVDFQLPPQAVVRGTARTATGGAPLADINVALVLSDAAGVYRATAFARTTADGSYRFENLRDSRYTVVARVSPQPVPEYLGLIAPATPCDDVTVLCDLQAAPVAILPAAAEHVVDLPLGRGAVIEGLQTSTLGGSVINEVVAVRVQALGGDAFVYPNVQVPDRWRFGPALPMTVRLRYGDPDSLDFAPEIHDELPCTQASCDVDTGMPVTLAEGDRLTMNEQRVPRRTISGRVVDQSNGLPIANVVVAGGTISNSLFDHALGVFNQGTHALTGPDGTYVLSGFGGGQFLVRTLDAEGHVDAADSAIVCTLANRFCSDAAGAYQQYPDTFTGHLALPDLQLPRAGSISGHVLMGTEPLVNVWVAVLTDDGRFAKRVRTDAAGAYRLTGLPPGTYRLHAEMFQAESLLYPNVPCPYPGFSSTVQCDALSGVPVTVTANNDTSGIDFLVAPTVLLSDGFEDPPVP